MKPWDLLGCFPVPWRADHLALNQVLKSDGIAKREVKVDGEISYGLRAP